MTRGEKPNFSELVTYYDDYWGRRGQKFTFDLQQRRLLILTELAATGLEHPNVLDFGCGVGWLSAEIARFGRVTGIDLSPAGIERARQGCPQGTFVAASVFDHRFPSAAFDVVVSQEVIEHLDDQAKYLRLAYDYLKPGGYLILTTPNRPVALGRGLTMEQMRRRGWLQPVENWLSEGDLRRLTRGLFDVRKICNFYFTRGWRVYATGILLTSRRLFHLARVCHMGKWLVALRKASVCNSLMGRGGLYLGMVAQKISR